MDGLNPETVRQIRELGGEELLGQLFGAFLKHGPARLQALRESLAGKDARGAEHWLHSLRSSAAVLGANALSELAAELEALAREDRLEDLGRRMGDLEGRLQKVLADLEKALADR